MNTDHTLAVRSLASGSDGNSVLLTTASDALLVDAGQPARRLLASLRACDCPPTRLRGIALTHEHRDHSRGALELAAEFGIPLICNHVTYLALRTPALPRIELPTGASLAIGPFRLSSFAVPHDALEPVGYRVSCGPHSVALVTDAGCVTPEMEAELAQAELLILEANHDLERLRFCGYPRRLQRRIASRHGHLANSQTAAALITIAAQDPRPRTVWLAHLSRQSNTPELALEQIGAALAAAGVTQMALTVAPRSQPGAWWPAAPARSVYAP